MSHTTPNSSHDRRDEGTRQQHLPLLPAYAHRLSSGAIGLAAAALLGLTLIVTGSAAAQEDDKSVDTAAATPALYEG
ncbi:MAG: hypothetical protein M3451_07800, partial [Chloroflexota bacterium]|nr:hypothetical protein [Chloroflexota bacterium]